MNFIDWYNREYPRSLICEQDRVDHQRQSKLAFEAGGDELRRQIQELIQELRSPVMQYGESNETWSAQTVEREAIADRLSELI